eukprot:c20392_g3_i2.p1 GENE.c20392_g3_i2~~c20392_g3_i2.p1  ORF type:complete len:763 (-),score=193.76 c20392_g3_i2:59-2347(-)
MELVVTDAVSEGDAMENLTAIHSLHKSISQIIADATKGKKVVGLSGGPFISVNTIRRVLGTLTGVAIFEPSRNISQSTPRGSVNLNVSSSAPDNGVKVPPSELVSNTALLSLLHHAALAHMQKDSEVCVTLLPLFFAEAQRLILTPPPTNSASTTAAAASAILKSVGKKGPKKRKTAVAADKTDVVAECIENISFALQCVCARGSRKCFDVVIQGMSEVIKDKKGSGRKSSSSKSKPSPADDHSDEENESGPDEPNATDPNSSEWLGAVTKVIRTLKDWLQCMMVKPEPRSKDAVLVVGAIKTILRKLEGEEYPERDQVVAMVREWAHTQCVNRNVTDKVIAAGVVNLLVDVSDHNKRAEVLKWIMQKVFDASEDNKAVPKPWSYNDTCDTNCSIVNDSSYVAVFEVVVSCTDAMLSDIDHILSRLRMTQPSKLLRSSETDLTKVSRRKLLELSCQSMVDLIDVWGFILVHSAESSQCEQVVRAVIHMYKILVETVKLVMVMWSDYCPEYVVRLVTLVEGRLTKSVFAYLEAVVNVDPQVGKNARSRIKRDGQLIPNVVFGIETFQSVVIKLAKHARVSDLMDQMRKPMERDFKVRWDQVLERLQAEDSDADTTAAPKRRKVTILDDDEDAQEDDEMVDHDGPPQDNEDDAEEADAHMMNGDQSEEEDMVIAGIDDVSKDVEEEEEEEPEPEPKPVRKRPSKAPPKNGSKKGKPEAEVEVTKPNSPAIEDVEDSTKKRKRKSEPHKLKQKKPKKAQQQEDSD